MNSRKKVVHNIALWLLDNFSDIERHDQDYAKIAADSLLRELEGIGMKPPFLNDRVEHTCGEFEICACHFIWEPKDE